MSYFEISDVERDIRSEQTRQFAKFGAQNHPDGTDSQRFASAAEDAKKITDTAAKAKRLTWRHILNEEVKEAYAEDDLVKLREELIQVAAVAVSWVEALDRRALAALSSLPDTNKGEGDRG